MRNLKKVISVVLVFALMLSLTVFAGAAGFADVDNDYQYKNAINLLSALNVLGGYEDGTFKPEREITRAEFSKILYVIYQGADDVNASMFTGETAFRDVAKTQWFAGYVNWASNNGVVGGYGDGTFQPDNKIKVKEAIKMVVASVTDKALSYPNGYIQEARALGLLDGVQLTSVDADATRGQIAQMAYNLLDTPSKLCQESTNEYVNGVEQYRKAKPITFVFELSSIGEPDKVNDKGDMINTVEFLGSYENKFLSPKELQEGQVYLDIDGSGSSNAFDYDGDLSDLYGQQVTVYFKETKSKNNPSLDPNDIIYSIRPNGTALHSTIKGLTMSGVNNYLVDGKSIPLPEITGETNTDNYYAFEKVYKQDSKDFTFSQLTSDKDKKYSTYFKLTAVSKNQPVTLIDRDDDGDYDFLIIYHVVNGAKVELYNKNTKTIRVKGVSSLAKAETVKFENAKGVENVAADDIVNYTVSKNGKNEIAINIVKADSLTGTMTAVADSGATVTVDGKAYTVNEEYRTAFLNDAADYLNESVTVYFDSLGMVARVEVADTFATDINVAYVKAATDNNQGRNDSSITASLTLVLVDGTEKTYPVDVKNDKDDVNDTEVVLEGKAAEWVVENREVGDKDLNGNGFIEYFWAYSEKTITNKYGEEKKIKSEDIVGNYIHFEVDEDTGEITRIVAIEEIDKYEPTNTKLSYEVKVEDDGKLCYNDKNGFYTLTAKGNVTIQEIAADNIVGMNYSVDYFNNNEVKAEFYTKDTMPEFEETGGKYILVLADGKVVAFLVADEGTATASDSVFGILKSYQKVSGAAKSADGKATTRYALTLNVNGKDEVFYTRDVASEANNVYVITSPDTNIDMNHKLLVNQLVRIKLDSYGKVVTKKVENISDSIKNKYVVDLEYATIGSFDYAIALSANAAGTAYKLLTLETWVNDVEEGLVADTDEFSPTYGDWIYSDEHIDGSITVAKETVNDKEVEVSAKWFNTCADTVILSYTGRLNDKAADTEPFQKMSKLNADAEIELTDKLDAGSAYYAYMIAYQTFTSDPTVNDPKKVYNEDDDLNGCLANVIVFTIPITVDNGQD